jgi:hypothetical protein
MTVSRFTRVAALLVALVVPRMAAAQACNQQMPPLPKPGPEHAVLKMDAGTWDATVEFVPAPGAPPMISKGVEVNTVGCGGLCLISDFKGEAMGSPFHGHGVTTWDAVKKKYIGGWTDSMSQGFAVTEGTYDPGTRKMSGSMEGPDMTGMVMKTRTVSEWRDANTRVMTAFAAGPDGKEMQVMKITSTRRK